MSLLKVRNLHLHFKTQNKKVYAVRGVNLDIHPGEVVAIVGESGCGKSATAKAILRLLPKESSTIDEGEIVFDQKNLLKFSEKEMRKVRGNAISMIFQDPLSSLNPTMTIGRQITESIRLHQKNTSRRKARQRALELLHEVGIPSPEKRLSQYPHELSGGQRQRVMIAIALSCSPKLLIADEPTTALDVTIQAQILELLNALRKKSDMSIALITHDLSIVAGLADRVLVMYAGEIVEEATTRELFKNPKHPYTQRLLQSLPRPDLHLERRLKAIKGHPPSLTQIKNHCSFCKRCKKAMNICALQQPPLFEVGNEHHAACWLYDERAIEQRKIHDTSHQDKKPEKILSP